jgi:hypothetical protein
MGSPSRGQSATSEGALHRQRHGSSSSSSRQRHNYNCWYGRTTLSVALVISAFAFLQVKQLSILIDLSNNNNNNNAEKAISDLPYFGNGDNHRSRRYRNDNNMNNNNNNTTQDFNTTVKSNVVGNYLNPSSSKLLSKQYNLEAPTLTALHSAPRMNATLATTTTASLPIRVAMDDSFHHNMSTISDWTAQHSKVLELILGQRLNSISMNNNNNNNSNNNTPNEELFPPRLPLPTKHDPSLLSSSSPPSLDDDNHNSTLDPLTHGVFFAGTGDIGFVERRIVPALQHLIHGLKIPRAKERAKLRHEHRRRRRRQTHQSSTNSTTATTTTTTTTTSQQKKAWTVANTGFALLASRDFQTSPLLEPMLDFFDVIYDPDVDLPDWPKQWRQSLHIIGKPQRLRGHAKAVKVHAMASSPFDVTVFMDFDNFPCRADFMEPLLELLLLLSNKHNNNDDDDGNYYYSDIALSNKYVEMNSIPKTLEQHWMAEHNTAMVVLNMTSTTATRNLLGLYVKAFHALWELHPADARVPPRDQPAFMIALMALRRLHHQQKRNEQATTTTTTTATAITTKQEEESSSNTMFLNHVDIPHDVFCRRLTTPEGQPVVCGGASPCLLAHKPDRIVKGRRGSFV